MALQPSQRDARRALTRRGLSSTTVDGPAASVVQRAGVSPEVDAVVVVASPACPDILRAVADATDARPDLAVVLLGPIDHDLDILAALASGVAGYLPPTTSPTELTEALVAVLAGAILAPPSVTGPLVRSLRSGRRRLVVPSAPDRQVALTAREWEVLVLLRQGRSTAEIAHRLIVSPVTIRTHIAALTKKFAVPTRTALLPTP